LAKEDEVLKRYLSNDERYADLINGVSFGGRQIVRAENLSDRDTQTGYHKNTRAVRGKSNTKYRDLFRRASFGANFAVIGVENQSQVFDFIRCSKSKKKMKELIMEDAAYQNLPKDAYDVMAVFTRSEELMQIREKQEGENLDMCQALKDWAAEERAEGRKEGRKEGITLGITQGMMEEKLKNLKAVMINLKFTAEKAMEVLNIPQEERMGYLEKLK